jgi:putative ABC transport system permease protein
MNTLAALGLLFKDFRHDAGRTWLTVLNLGLVIAAYLATAGLADALGLIRDDRLTGSNNLLLLSANVLDPTDSVVQMEQLQAAQAAADAFGAGVVRKISPLTLHHLRIDGHIFQVSGAPPGDLQDVYDLRLVEGRLPQARDEIVVTGSVLALTGKTLGGTLSILGTTFRIAGLVDAPGNSAAIWMTDAAGLALFGESRAFQIGVLQIDTRIPPARIQQVLEQDTRLQGFAVYQEQQYAAQFTLSVEGILGLARFFNLVALLLVSFGAYNVTLLSLTERGQELGILRAVGFSANGLHTLLLARTLLIALLAFTVAWIAIQAYFGFSQQSVMLYVNTLQLRLTPLRSAWGLALCLGFSVLGAWLPGQFQFRRSVADLIREWV